MVPARVHVTIRPWQRDDEDLLRRLLGDPLMTEHVGGPESPEKLAERHERYVTGAGRSGGEQFAILLGPGNEAVGWVGYWESEWRGRRIWEVGWSVLREYQQLGVAAGAAAQLLEHVRAVGWHRWVHAFPSVDNEASNAVCRKIGMRLAGPVDIDYPPGRPMRSNDWQLDLRERPSG